jgi:RNA polymerase sigma-70 factor (ECF subfamily)
VAVVASRGEAREHEEEAVSDSRSSPARARPATEVTREALSHLDALHHFARYLTGSDAEAEDLVQDTFARALGAEASFVPGTNLRAWLFRILRNAHIDARRRSRSAPRTGRTDAEGEPAESALFARQPLFGDAELEALRGVIAGQIERALLTLSDDARVVVLLDLEGFTEPEVAEVVGCAQGTVKSRLARAREALRHELGEFWLAGPASDARAKRGGER